MVTVDVPTAVVPITTLPELLTVTGMTMGLDETPPKLIVTLALDVEESPVTTSPAVCTPIVQGLTSNVLPKANGEVSGKVDAVMVMMHEPKVNGPDAV